MQGEHPVVRLEPSIVELRQRALLAVVGLGIAAAARGADILARQWSLQLVDASAMPGRPPDMMERLHLADKIVNCANLAITLSFVASAVVFLLWSYRLLSVTRGLGAPVTASPSDVIIGFVIPIYSLFRPYQFFSEVNRALAPDNVEPVVVHVDPTAQASYRGAAFVAGPPPRSLPMAPVGLWWGLYVVASIGGRVASAVAPLDKTRAGIVTAYQADMLVSTLFIVSAIAAMSVVRGLTARAEERYHRLRASTPESLFAQGITIGG